MFEISERSRPRRSLAASFVVFVLLSSAGLAAQEIPTASPEEVGMSTPRLAEIDALFARSIESGTLQGGVAVVARRGQVVHFKSYGLSDVGSRAPMRKDSIFRMASSSKPVLGVATMIAIEEGLISAQDPVEKYLPEFRDMKVAVLKEPSDEDVSPELVWGDVPEHRLVPARRPITIHDLLTHTAGLGTFGLGTAVAGQVKKSVGTTLADSMKTYSSMALDYQPGTRWNYSPGIGHDVVARILEVVTGTPFDQFAKERIFEPLGMKDTHFFLPKEKESRRVVIDGLDAKVKGWDQPSRYVSASGGLSSTAEDYLRFELMLLGKGQLFGRRILSEESVATLSSNQVGDLFSKGGKESAGQGFGYTVSVVLDPDASKSARGKGAFGWGGAHGTVTWTDPSEELVGVYLVQQPTKEVPAEFEQAIRRAIVD